MINGMTAEEYNAQERLRGSIVAKLRGYTPMEDGDTEEALKTEYLEITGEAYQTEEEESARREWLRIGSAGTPRNRIAWTPTSRSSATPWPRVSWIARQSGMPWGLTS